VCGPPELYEKRALVPLANHLFGKPQHSTNICASFQLKFDVPFAKSPSGPALESGIMSKFIHYYFTKMICVSLATLESRPHTVTMA
jgi:hypothetical protein